MDMASDKRKQDFFDTVKVRSGGVYLVLEERADLALRMFEDSVNKEHLVGVDAGIGGGGEASDGVGGMGGMGGVGGPGGFAAGGGAVGSTDRRPEGLLITRNYPLEIRSEYSLARVPMIWLTTNMSTKEKAINPSSITRLNMAVIEFIESTKRGLILLDCLEYLVTQNNFDTVLRLLQSWNDRLVGTKISILISLDPLTLTLQQLHLLKKEMQDVLVID